MARQFLNPPRKRRTREHVIADMSTNYVEKIALQCGYAVDKVWHDYGLDLAVFTFDKQGYLESGVLWMQLKATDSLKTMKDGTAILLRIERKDVLAWIATVYPVILVVYDAEHDCGYWVSIHGYFANKHGFAKLRGKTVTIRIPTANVLNATAMREFAREKAKILGTSGEQS